METSSTKDAARLPPGGKVRRSAGLNSRLHSYYTTSCQVPKYGEVDGAVWRKRARASRHMLRYPQRAWALDIADVDAAEACGAREVEIEDVETGQTYWTTLEAIRRDGFTFDRGYGEQVALPLASWVQRSQSDAPGRQLSFLGGLP